MRPWKMLLALIIVLSLVAAAGCTPKEDDIAYPGELVEDNPLSDPDQDALAPEPDPVDPAAEETDKPADTGQNSGQSGGQTPQTVKISLYFSNQGAIETGTPGTTGYVTGVTRELPYTKGVLRLALQELIKGPQAGEGTVGRTLPASTRILSLTIENKVAIINFSSDLLTAADSPGGSLGGAVFLQSIVYTATQFSTVDAALVKVNGEAYSDGHYIWDQPVRRSDLP